MRVVIEIEDGDQARAATALTGVTLTLSPDSAPHDDLGERAVDSSPDGDDQAAGAAPADAAPDEPEAFSDEDPYAVDDAQAVDIDVGSAHDAGAAAPGADVDTGDASDEEVDADDAPDAESPDDDGAVDAGSAPGGVDDVESSDEDSGIGDLGGVPATDAGAAPADLVDEAAAETAEEVDDLTAISGLGPKSAAALMTAGVTTYAELASRSDEELRQIMSDAGLAVSVESWTAEAESLS